MTRELFDLIVASDIRNLMRQIPDTQYIEMLAAYLGADPALLKCLVHTGRCKLAGNRIFDLRQADDALRRYQKEQPA